MDAVIAFFLLLCLGVLGAALTSHGRMRRELHRHLREGVERRKSERRQARYN